jgi:polygalacturonase
VLLQIAFSSVAFSQQTGGLFNVKDYGAIGDGKAIDSRAINETIIAASKAGGGTVYLPAGDYLSGSIRLTSNVAVYLGQGSTIIATTDSPEVNYDSAEASANTVYQDYGHSHWHNALIWGDSLHDISIIGPGKIYGKGLVKDWAKDGKTADKSISLHECYNVTIRDVTIVHGGWFAILATGVDNFTLDNLKIDTNRDGIDIDCCKNVRVSNCSINSPYDDGLCLKSSYALGYARATENVTITNCQLSGYDEGTFLDGTFKRLNSGRYGYRPTGRIKFGTESNGGFENIAITNCVFDYCGGLALESVDGGHLEDVTISNITMRDIVNDPIFLRLGARMRGPQGTPIGELRRVKISNVIVYGVDSMHCCTVCGLPGHDVEDIQLSNIVVYYKGGGSREQAEQEIPENENEYPEPGMFGPAPACGLFVRHAANVQLRDVQFHSLSPDYRPAFVFDDAREIYMNHVAAEKEIGGDKLILNNVSDLNIYQSPGLPDQRIENAKHAVLQ